MQSIISFSVKRYLTAAYSLLTKLYNYLVNLNHIRNIHCHLFKSLERVVCPCYYK